jgi:hypothetical protein
MGDTAQPTGECGSMSATALVRYDAMCTAIAAAYAVDEVKDIRDKAVAIEVYAKQAHNIEAERQACEIRLRAERKCGELLREREKAKPRGSNQHEDVSRDPTHPRPLSDLGITRDQSSQWQKLATVPADLFERELQRERPTTNGIIAACAQPEPRDKVGPAALWLWGRLKDFDRDGLLDLDPNEVIEGMLGHMQTTTKELAPRVAAWLGRIRP